MKDQESLSLTFQAFVFLTMYQDINLWLHKLVGDIPLSSWDVELSKLNSVYVKICFIGLLSSCNLKFVSGSDLPYRSL